VRGAEAGERVGAGKIIRVRGTGCQLVCGLGVRPFQWMEGYGPRVVASPVVNGEEGAVKYNQEGNVDEAPPPGWGVLEDEDPVRAIH
jgi:hypothetical protein